MEEQKKEPSTQDPAELSVNFIHTSNLSELFQNLRISIAVTTYQARRLLTFAAQPPRLSMWMRIFDHSTGLAYRNQRLALCTRNQVVIFEQLAPAQLVGVHDYQYDYYFIPRHSYVTGDIGAHDVAWHNDELIVVNSLFSCLCSPSLKWSFQPLWKPAFVTEYACEDRCHLNGLAMDENGPRYVTALGTANTAGGWRANREKGGVILDVASGEVVSAGLSMPHSPRLYNGVLWVLESGTGELQRVDISSGVRETVACLPGYIRGLAFYDRYAFIGLSLIREKHYFGGLAIEGRCPKLKCAVIVFDIVSGEELGFIEFTKGVTELYDIAVLPGVLNPQVIGFHEPTISRVFSYPSPAAGL